LKQSYARRALHAMEPIMHCRGAQTFHTQPAAITYMVYLVNMRPTATHTNHPSPSTANYALPSADHPRSTIGHLSTDNSQLPRCRLQPPSPQRSHANCGLPTDNLQPSSITQISTPLCMPHLNLPACALRVDQASPAGCGSSAPHALHPDLNTIQLQLVHGLQAGC
jgi:hypothetical protein